MTGKIHVAVGTATLAILCVKYPQGFEFFDVNIIPAIGLVTAAAGSKAPDIDLGRSSVGMKHKITSKVVSKVGGGHRGITHTLLFPALLTIMLIYVNEFLASYAFLASFVQSLIFGFWFGWVMHIFADLFNGKGVPLFWPLMKGKVHIMDVDSDGWQAWCWLIIYIGLVVFIVFKGVI